MATPPNRLTPNAPITGWTVTSQQQSQWIGPNNQAVRGVEVFFTTGKGVAGSVRIPESQYSPINVRAAIAAQAAQLDEVQGLSG